MADDRIRWDEKPVRLGKKGFVTWKTAMNELNKRVGLLKDLRPSVEDKSNIVNAISGVSERVGILKNLKTAVKTSIVNAINELHERLTVVSIWLGLKTEVDAKYITAHGNTISKLVNYLLGRDETVATAASVEEVAAQASAAATKAENAESLATTANTTATTASEWLGDKSEVSSNTLTHGNTVSALIEYLANKPSDNSGLFVGASRTVLSGKIASKASKEFNPTATLPENAGYRVITLASIPFAQGGDGYLNPAITWSCQKNGILRADNFTDAEQNIGSAVCAIIIGVKIPL